MAYLLTMPKYRVMVFPSMPGVVVMIIIERSLAARAATAAAYTLT